MESLFLNYTTFEPAKPFVVVHLTTSVQTEKDGETVIDERSIPAAFNFNDETEVGTVVSADLEKELEPRFGCKVTVGAFFEFGQEPCYATYLNQDVDVNGHALGYLPHYAVYVARKVLGYVHNDVNFTGLYGGTPLLLPDTVKAQPTLVDLPGETADEQGNTKKGVAGFKIFARDYPTLDVAEEILTAELGVYNPEANRFVLVQAGEQRYFISVSAYHSQATNIEALVNLGLWCCGIEKTKVLFVGDRVQISRPACSADDSGLVHIGMQVSLQRNDTGATVLALLNVFISDEESPQLKVSTVDGTPNESYAQLQFWLTAVLNQHLGRFDVSGLLHDYKTRLAAATAPTEEVTADEPTTEVDAVPDGAPIH